MEKPKIWPLATKPLNQSSPNFAQMIMSRTSPPVWNFDQIGQGVFSPHMREISLVFFGYYFVFLFFSEATAEAPTLILTQNTSKDAVPRKDVPLGGLETKIEWLDPHFREKPPFCGPVLAGQKIFERKPLNNGDAHE